MRESPHPTRPSPLLIDATSAARLHAAAQATRSRSPEDRARRRDRSGSSLGAWARHRAPTPLARSGLAVDLAAALPELLRLLAQPLREHDGLGGHALLRGVFPHFLRDLHRAELRAAHRAEVRDLRALGGQRLVVELARGLGIEREIELILPAELEARL